MAYLNKFVNSSLNCCSDCGQEAQVYYSSQRGRQCPSCYQQERKKEWDRKIKENLVKWKDQHALDIPLTQPRDTGN
jgi:recombinational DNA repair protein (RecF pathway)